LFLLFLQFYWRQSFFNIKGVETTPFFIGQCLPVKWNQCPNIK
jgi:hypothetical protein